MRKTSVQIDDHLVEQAQNLLGTNSINETIDRALLEVVRSEARREEIRALAQMDGLDLSNEQVMAEAWRWSEALVRARRPTADHERTLLSAEDRAAVLAALDTSAEPSGALREAMALHRDRVADDS